MATRLNAQKLIDTARTLVAGDKGLLAMDESNPICKKRFAGQGILQTEEGHVLAAQQALYHRARYRRAARRDEYNAAMERR
jgi:fructose-bisphosphate aldolase class 1